MIPARYQKAKYEDVPQNIREPFEKIRETRKGLYLWGGIGVGKTHATYALLQKAEELGLNPLVENTTELLHSIRSDFDRPWGEKEYAGESLMEHRGLLILDDIGAERMTEWVAETFYLILNKRYNKMLPTIYTSNLPIEDLAERLGDRIASRIVESCDIVKIEGRDRRVL